MRQVGRLLAAGVEPLRLWDVESGEEVARQPLSAYWAREAVSPDGRLRAGCSGKQVAVVDIESGRELTLLKEHNAWETEFAFTHDPRFLLMRDGLWGETRLWDLETGDEVPSELWADGDRNARRFSRNTIARHPQTGEVILSIRDGSVSSAALDRDCQRVFFATGDGVTRIWDVKRGMCSVLADRPLPVRSLAAGDD